MAEWKLNPSLPSTSPTPQSLHHTGLLKKGSICLPHFHFTTSNCSLKPVKCQNTNVSLKISITMKDLQN